MKKKEIQSLRSKTHTEIQKLVIKAREDLAHAQLKRLDEKNTNMVKNIKHDIARLLTLIQEKKEVNIKVVTK